MCAQAAMVAGPMRAWRTLVLNFWGPERVESPETFRDFRLELTLRDARSGERLRIPGFFAGDGTAADTSATGGSVWRAMFTPPSDGEWNYVASFRSGPEIAVSRDPEAGQRVDPIDGARGRLLIAPTSPGGPDLRELGPIALGDGGYAFPRSAASLLEHAAPALDDLLALRDFDGAGVFEDAPERDGSGAAWRPGDPIWADGRGRTAIGLLNAASDSGATSIHLKPLSAARQGEARLAWRASPWAPPPRGEAQPGDAAELCFDVSRLAQWEIAFAHAQALGLVLNVDLERPDGRAEAAPLARALFLREMVARFAHHNGLVWRIAAGSPDIDTLQAFDAYQRPIAIPTGGAAAPGAIAPGAAEKAQGASSAPEDADGQATTSRRASKKKRRRRDGPPAATETLVSPPPQTAAEQGAVDATPPPAEASAKRGDDLPRAPSPAPAEDETGAAETGRGIPGDGKIGDDAPGDDATGADGAAPVAEAPPQKECGADAPAAAITLDLGVVDFTAARPEWRRVELSAGLPAARLVGEQINLVARFSGPDAGRARVARLSVVETNWSREEAIDGDVTFADVGLSLLNALDAARSDAATLLLTALSDAAADNAPLKEWRLRLLKSEAAAPGTVDDRPAHASPRYRSDAPSNPEGAARGATDRERAQRQPEPMPEVQPPPEDWSPFGAETSGRSGLKLRAIEIIDSDEDRAIATLNPGGVLRGGAVLGRSLTVKAAIVGENLERVAQLSACLVTENGRQDDADRPFELGGEIVGHFYHLDLGVGRQTLVIKAYDSAEGANDRRAMLISKLPFTVR